MKKTLFFLVLILSAQYHFGQEIISISKNDLLMKASEQNLQIQLANRETNLAEADLLQTRAMYLPNITASYTAISTNNPLMAFGSKLNQARVTMMDFNPDNLNNPKNIFNFATKVEIQQPIFNKDAIYQKKAGKAKVEALSFKTERTKQYIQFELSKAYMQLQLAYKAIEVLENAKKTTLANKKTIDNYYKNGMIQKSEALYMDVRVTEIDNQLQFAKSNVKNASDYIFFLLNEDGNNKTLKPIETLTYQEQILEENHHLNLDRKDLKAYQKSLEAYDLMMKASKAKFLPRLNAFGSFEIYDNKPYEFNANGYLAGLQLSWNIFDGYKANSEQQKYKAEILKTQTEIEQYNKQSQLELNKSYRQVSDADHKVKLTNQAWEQTKEAYRIRKNRYDQGLEKSSDLLTSETIMAQKELEYHQAIFEYNTALEYLKFLK